MSYPSKWHVLPSWSLLSRIGQSLCSLAEDEMMRINLHQFVARDSDRMLRDIGLTRSDLDSAASFVGDGPDGLKRQADARSRNW